MNREQMLKSIQAIESLEQKFNRKLTQKEIDLYLNYGLDALLGECSMTERDFATMKRCVKLITAGFTESEEHYDSELDEENFDALEVFKSLVNDLEVVRERKEKEIAERANKKKEYKESRESTTYREEDDKSLNERFTPQAQKEADESATSYNPEKDESLMHPSEHDCDKEEMRPHLTLFDKFLTMLFDPKLAESIAHESEHKEAEAENTGLLKLVERLKNGESITMDHEMIKNVSEYISNNLTNYIFKVTDNNVSLKMFK